MYYRYWKINGACFRCRNPKDKVKTIEYKTGDGWRVLAEYITRRQREAFIKTYLNHISK
jgi:hypothetical protein